MRPDSSILSSLRILGSLSKWGVKTIWSSTHVLFCVTVIMFCSIASKQNYSKQIQGQYYSPAQDLSISRSEMNQLRTQAIAGNSGAIKRIAMYYASIKVDEEAAYAWWRLGESFGDEVCAANAKSIRANWRKFGPADLPHKVQHCHCRKSPQVRVAIECFRPQCTRADKDY
jgi:hypothetical protein